ADQGARDRHVVLVGLMGVGKSTVGRRLAKELARPFADVDEQVELRAGLVIPRLFEERGEEAFRTLEAEVLADLLDRPEPLVVAAGGGAVTRAENRARLRAARAVVVWLQASPAFLAARTDPTHRPLLAGDDPAGALARLLAERRPLYAAAADLAVDAEPFHQRDEQPTRAPPRHTPPARSWPATPPPAPWRGCSPSAGRSTRRSPTSPSTSSPSTRATRSPSGRSPATSPRWSPAPRWRRRDHPHRHRPRRRRQLPGPRGVGGAAPAAGGARRGPAGRRRHPGRHRVRGRPRLRARGVHDRRGRGGQDAGHGRGAVP